MSPRDLKQTSESIRGNRVTSFRMMIHQKVEENRCGKEGSFFRDSSKPLTLETQQIQISKEYVRYV